MVWTSADESRARREGFSVEQERNRQRYIDHIKANNALQEKEKERKKREKEKDDDKMKVQLVLMFFVAPVVIIFMIVLLIIQISGNGHILTGDSKIASEYKQKRKEVVELQEKLSEKITKLGVAETEFKATIASNVGTIQSNIRRGQIRSFNDAVRNQESNTKLKIIAKAQAYLEIVTAEKRAVARAGVELQGIRANLDLDLTMLKATDQEEMDDLIKKLDNVITKIKPVAEEYVINDYNRGSSDLKSTWNKYFIQK